MELRSQQPVRLEHSINQIKIHTTPRIFLKIIVELCLCLAGELALTFLVINQTGFNAEAVSRFVQAKLITTGVMADPNHPALLELQAFFPTWPL